VRATVGVTSHYRCFCGSWTGSSDLRFEQIARLVVKSMGVMREAVA